MPLRSRLEREGKGIAVDDQSIEICDRRGPEVAGGALERRNRFRCVAQCSRVAEKPFFKSPHSPGEKKNSSLIISLSLETFPKTITITGTGPSRGFVLPGAKQGIHDQRWWDAHGLSAALAAAAAVREELEGGAPGSRSAAAAAAGSAAAAAAAASAAALYPNPQLDALPAAARDRYAAYDLVSPGVKRYNVWWASHEVVYPPPRGLSVPGGGAGGGGGRGATEGAPAPATTTAAVAEATRSGGGRNNVAVASAAVSASSLSKAESGAVLADAAAAEAAAAKASASSPSSSSTSSCPEGSFLWPASERHRAAVNASRHHCYDRRQDAVLQAYLALDAAHGVQSYATVWKAPAAARHPGCAGFDNGNGGSEKSSTSSSPSPSSSPPPTREFGGCAPNWDPQAMADFADFIAYLADRHRLSGGGFLAKQQQQERQKQQQQQHKATAATKTSNNGSGAGGGFAGYIIWNEAASALWFDTSPLIAPTSGVLKNQSQAAAWADAYAALLEAAERSLRSVGARPALVLASLDTLWASPGEKGPIYSAGAAGSNSSSSSSFVFPLGGVHAGRAHLGSGNLVEALWRRLGTRVDWSLVREFFFFSFLISLSPSLSLSLSLFRFLFFFFDPCCFFVFLSLSLEKDAHSETKFHFSKYKTTKQKMQAVHPYSTPIAPSQLPSNKASSSPLPPLLQLLPPILHFSDLRRLSELQAERAAEAPSKIVGVRVGADKGARAPQAVVAATEQGWPSAGLKAHSAAAAICEAHSTVAPAAAAAARKDEKASSSTAASPSPDSTLDGIIGVAFVTHNDFQGVSKTDPTGLVPAAAGTDLRSLEPGASPTLSAYESTKVGVWNVESGHYCCAVVGLGCGGGGGGGLAR